MALTPEEKIIKEFLIKCAITKKIVTYQNLSTVAKLGLDMSLSKDRNTLGELLCNISRQEHKEGRPILSALVITANEKNQGDGFYKLCEELEYGNWEKLKRDEDFSKKLINECYQFYFKSKEQLRQQ